jgi:hypothetical protein
MNEIDPKLEPYVGPEGSLTIVSTLILSWLVFQIIRLLTSRVTGSGRAIADEDDDDVLSGKEINKSDQAFGATVLLCGPPAAGKTRLFYQLCHDANNMPTVMSIKANVGFSQPVEGSKPVRYMDWPGHASLTDAALLPVLKAQPRVVLVLDAMQPVAAAADVLYQLAAYAHSKKKQKPEMMIFVACHKKDFPKAKKWQRCKIQIRTELERLLSVRASSKPEEDLWWPAGKPIELDQLAGVKIHFGATSCEGKGTSELAKFCQTGELPEEES